MTDKIYFMDIIPKSDDFIEGAIETCLNTMYQLSQPSITLDELKEIGKDMTQEEHSKDPLYQRYYLPQDLYSELIDHFLDIYGLRSDWHDHVKTIQDYLMIGGLKDEFINGQRTAVKTPKLEDIIGKENADKVNELINDCDNFYNFNHDECVFRFNVMNYSPSSNKESVEQYWREHGKTDFTIDETFYTKEDEE